MRALLVALVLMVGCGDEGDPDCLVYVDVSDDADICSPCTGDVVDGVCIGGEQALDEQVCIGDPETQCKQIRD